MTARAELHQYRQLVRIGEARLAIARGRLADAEANCGQCADTVAEAEQKSGEAFAAWSDSIGSAILGPIAVKATADRLLAAEDALAGTRKQLEAATREAEEASGAFQAAEAHARAEADRSRKLNRRYHARTEERDQQEIADLLLGRRKEFR